MILCEIRKMDGKCRLQIPSEFIRLAGGKPDGHVYVRFNERTREIKIIIKKETHDARKQTGSGSEKMKDKLNDQRVEREGK